MPACCQLSLLAGKSFLLNHIIAFLRQEYAEDFNASVAVTAATGIAATHISGTTLHSQTGCGIPQQLEDFDRMWKQQNRDRWRKLKVCPTYQPVVIARNLALFDLAAGLFPICSEVLTMFFVSRAIQHGPHSMRIYLC